MRKMGGEKKNVFINKQHSIIIILTILYIAPWFTAFSIMIKNIPGKLNRKSIFFFSSYFTILSKLSFENVKVANWSLRVVLKEKTPQINIERLSKYLRNDKTMDRNGLRTGFQSVGSAGKRCPVFCTETMCGAALRITKYPPLLMAFQLCKQPWMHTHGA